MPKLTDELELIKAIYGFAWWPNKDKVGLIQTDLQEELFDREVRRNKNKINEAK